MVSKPKDQEVLSHKNTLLFLFLVASDHCPLYKLGLGNGASQNHLEKLSFSWSYGVEMTKSSVAIGHVSRPHGGRSPSVGGKEANTQSETGSRNLMKDNTLL